MSNKNEIIETISVKQDWGIIHEDDFAISVHQLNEEVRVHIHDCYEFELLIEGEIDLRLNGRQFNVKRGNFWVSLPNNLHNVIKKTDEVRILCIKIKDTILSNKVHNLLATYGDGIIGKVDEAELQIFLETFENIKTIYSSVKSELCRNILVKNIIESIIVTFVDKCDDFAYELTESMAEHNIFEAVSYVKKHFAEEITATDMAKKLGYTPNYFSMKFKSLTGKNFIDMVNDERLGLAYYMLSTMNISVNDVAEYVGYSSIAYFSRMFKKKFGKTPREIKNTNKKS